MKSLIQVVLLVFAPSLTSTAVAAVPPADLNLCAQYSVWLPAQMTGELPFNEFAIDSYRIDRRNEGRERMIFELPLDLTGGLRKKIILTVHEHKGDVRRLLGARGRALCKGPWTQMRCDFRFTNLALSSAQNSNYLVRKYSPSSRREALIQIAARFGGDPIGVAAVGACPGH